MNYVPWTEGGVVVAERELGGYRAVLLTELESPGGIKYAHVLLVTAAGSDAQVLAVASERMATPGPGTHVLGLFPGDGHVNLGASDEWANLFVAHDPRNWALMAAANRQYGTGTVGVAGAAAGMKSRTEDWQMAQTRRSPGYTTSWDGLAEARA